MTKNDAIRVLQSRMDRKIGKREALQGDLVKTRARLADLNRTKKILEEAQRIVMVVAQATQEELEYHISELGSLALAAVFPDPYRLCLSFELKRGRSEAFLSFKKKKADEPICPLTCSGGGPVDVASFALRISLWALQSPRSRSTIVLDEPFRFVSRDLQEKAASMLREMAERLGLQIILVTHETTLVEGADRVFQVSMGKDRRTKIEVEGGSK